jgi:hypothetical protein
MKESTLQYDNHDILYKKLLGVTEGVKIAIREENIEVLWKLAGEHKSVMEELYKIGFSDNRELLTLINKIDNNVSLILSDAKTKYDKLCRDLKIFALNEKHITAYTKGKEFNRIIRVV